MLVEDRVLARCNDACPALSEILHRTVLWCTNRDISLKGQKGQISRGFSWQIHL